MGMYLYGFVQDCRIPKHHQKSSKDAIWTWKMIIESDNISLNPILVRPIDGTALLSSHVFQSFSGGYLYMLAHLHVSQKFVQCTCKILSHSQSPFLSKVHTRRCRNLSRPCTNWKQTRPIADSAGLEGKLPQHHSGWKEKHHFHLYDL